MTLTERFWAKVDRRGPDECWPWTAALSDSGYGVIREAGRGSRLLYAHRVSMIIDGKDPGPSARHTCDNPVCVNPRHLLHGTQRQNIEDMTSRRRHGNSRVDDDDVREIRTRVAAGESQRSLAAEYGISQPAVGKIARRVSYAYVSDAA